MNVVFAHHVFWPCPDRRSAGALVRSTIDVARVGCCLHAAKARRNDPDLRRTHRGCGLDRRGHCWSCCGSARRCVARRDRDSGGCRSCLPFLLDAAQERASWRPVDDRQPTAFLVVAEGTAVMGRCSKDLGVPNRHNAWTRLPNAVPSAGDSIAAMRSTTGICTRWESVTAALAFG